MQEFMAFSCIFSGGYLGNVGSQQKYIYRKPYGSSVFVSLLCEAETGGDSKADAGIARRGRRAGEPASVGSTDAAGFAQDDTLSDLCVSVPGCAFISPGYTFVFDVRNSWGGVLCLPGICLSGEP